MKQWYVVKTKPQREAQVCLSLARQNCETFFPQLQGHEGLKPLFPTYLFLKADLANSHQHQHVRFTRGVRYILGDAGGPVPIGEIVISTMRESMVNGSIIERLILFHEGDTVRVKKGILADLVGIVEKQLPAEGRVQILFKWWTTTMRAKVKYRDLEKAA